MDWKILRAVVDRLDSGGLKLYAVRIAYSQESIDWTETEWIWAENEDQARRIAEMRIKAKTTPEGTIERLYAVELIHRERQDKLIVEVWAESAEAAEDKLDGGLFGRGCRYYWRSTYQIYDGYDTPATRRAGDAGPGH